MRSRLERITTASGTRLCIGIDPQLAVIQPLAVQAGVDVSKVSSEYLLQWLGEHLLLAGVEKQVRCVKFQMAFFEAWGSKGVKVLETLVKLAKSKDFFVILDGKRGDIASSMQGYGQMAFDHFDADALTINPYMGSDVWLALSPWTARGKGVFVVWRTSNGSGDSVQMYPYCDVYSQRQISLLDLSMAKLYEHIWSLVQSSGVKAFSWGLVLGATKVGELDEKNKQKLLDVPLLLPGIGAQGGELDACLLKPWHICNVSRSLLKVDERRVRMKVEDVMRDSIAHYASLLKLPKGEVNDGSI